MQESNITGRENLRDQQNGRASQNDKSEQSHGGAKVSEMITVAVVLAVLILISRLLPHAANFSPTLALILLGGTIFSTKNKWAFIVPILALIISDAVLAYRVAGSFSEMAYPGILFNYLAFSWVIALGLITKADRMGSVLMGAIGSSVIFFVVSNLGVWMQGGLYPLTADGLKTCFVMAIPFFHKTLLSTVITAAVIYPVWNFTVKSFALKLARA